MRLGIALVVDRQRRQTWLPLHTHPMQSKEAPVLVNKVVDREWKATDYPGRWN